MSDRGDEIYVRGRTFYESEGDDGCVSVMQFNCLADALSDAFPHASSQDILKWSHRQKLFEDLFDETQCHFMCLEEVDHFDDFFVPYLSKYGYQGVHHQRRKDPTFSKDGVALFWKSERFEMISSSPISSSRKTFGILGLFEDRLTLRRFNVGVVHLTAKPGNENARVDEMKIFISSIDNEHDVLIGGDFNDVPESLVCDYVRQRNFTSAYTHTIDSWTTWKKRSEVVKRVIDYIWYRSSTLQVAELLGQPSDISFPAMLPDSHFPSDHINIGAIFKA